MLMLVVGMICLAFNIATEVNRDTSGGAAWYNRMNNGLTAVGAWVLSVLAIISGIIMILS